MDTVTPAAEPTPVLIFETLNAHSRSAALRAAIELDLFRAIGEGTGDIAGLARFANASERGVRILCDFLVISGLLAKQGDRYVHTPTSAAFLDPQSPVCLASTARFLGRPEIMRPFTMLTDIVRSGRTILEGEGTVSPENPVWVEFAKSMAPMMGPLVGPLASVAMDGLKGPVRVLDVAAGHGLFGIEFAKQNAQAQITAVDWAPVLEVATGNATRAGVADRYRLLPGSAFEVPFGGPFDVVLLTNFLHHFDRSTCVSLLTKVHAALGPGGRVATLEFVPNDDRVSPPNTAAFAMIMLATTASGDAYTLREYDSMYRDAGFDGATGHPIPQAAHTIVLGVKR